jgi:hypothetical protein
MRERLTAVILLSVIGLTWTSASLASELSGRAAAEGTFFFSDALYSSQERNSASFAVEPEFYHEWENGSSLTFVPFARLASDDSRRTHFDVRELNYLLLGESWELRVGLGKVFWGTTEFVHLIDIVNQTDLVENIDEEDKLGQPMVHLSVPREWGILDAFVLPYFRERTYPGQKGRLRLPLVVDVDEASYESADKERHVDFALRYNHSISDWDFGIYHFAGTGREPTMLLGSDSGGQPVLTPFYELINQTGLDLQLIAGEWLFKAEALYRSGQGDPFFAAVGGLEHSFPAFLGTVMDVDVIGEWTFDERGERATTIFQNDAMLGFRLAVNDQAGSELLAGLLVDVERSTRIVQIEASRRIGMNLRAVLEARGFLSPAESDLLYGLRDDDFLRLELAYYF